MEDLTKLKELVIQEANSLKENATKDELNTLDFDILDVGDSNGCIYGQMTGDCFSYRAHELLAKCAAPYSKWVSEFEDPIEDEFTLGYDSYVRVSFSALERYICLKYAKNDVLISFLKGEIEELTINDL